jgi:hypothetical protein
MNEHVKCPYCGFVYSEGDEAFMPGSLTLASSFDEECVECHQPFIVIRDVKAVYHTAKKGLPS